MPAIFTTTRDGFRYTPFVARTAWPLRVWLQNLAARRRLRRCASLDPRFARDIGMTLDELTVVSAGPPWRGISRQ